MNKQERIILGIDPGTTAMGYGVLRMSGGRIELLAAGTLRFPAGSDHTLRLKAIFDGTTAVISEHLPDELAIEAQFFGKNVQSMLKLGRAQGVAIAAALQRELSVTEYAPKRVKQSVTGNGNASKEQVAAMLAHVFGSARLPNSLDATDALAVALCHCYTDGSITRSGNSARGSSSWGSFVRNNPDRLG